MVCEAKYRYPGPKSYFWTLRAHSRGRYNVGTPLSPDEIKGFDFVVGPEGKELPPGHGTAKEGAEIFAKKCALCHGKDGQGGAVQRLVLGSPGHPHRGPFKDTEKSATSYYPYPTIAWDYIHRAMPADKPGSLTPDEVYAMVAFLFYRNGIIQENDVLDAKTLPKIEMPNPFRQSRCGRPSPRNPVGTERVAVAVIGFAGFSLVIKSILAPMDIVLVAQPLGGGVEVVSKSA